MRESRAAGGTRHQRTVRGAGVCFASTRYWAEHFTLPSSAWKFISFLKKNSKAGHREKQPSV